MGGSEPSAFVPAEIEGRVLSTFIAHSPASFMLLDHRLNQLEVSPRWTSDWSGNREAMVGKHHYETYPDLPEHILMAHRRGLAGETVSAPDDRFTMQGEEYHAAWHVRPWGNPKHGTGGLIVYAENLAVPKRSPLGNAIGHAPSALPADSAPSRQLSWVRDGRLAAQDILSSYREIACTCPPGYVEEHRAHQLDCRAHPSVPVLKRAEQGIRNLSLLEQWLEKKQGS
ncbi:MAG TPA: PAS domain-containing protein [Terriglobales bacterium]